MKINKLDKREKNSIIINFSMFFILFLITISYFLFNIVPNIKDIEKQKDDTIKLYNIKTDIEKKWINFEEFKSLYNSSKIKTQYIDNIIETIDEDFFNKNLKNNDNSINYTTFIDNKTKEFNSLQNQSIIDSQKEKLLKILPKYSEIISDNDMLSDFKFINYIESILATFNLQNSSPIGIMNINSIDDYSIEEKTKSNWLSSNIYFINLNLVLEWTKSNILDFLYFIENVWNIELEDNEIIINKNYSPLSKNWIKKVLKWEMLKPDYNIFENQIIDISEIKFNEYIDSSYIQRLKNESLVEFLNRTQWNQLIKFNAQLNFYVKWIPVYEIRGWIDTIFSNLKQISSEIKKNINNKDLKVIDIINLKKYNETIKSLEKEFLEINKSKNNVNLLEQNFKRVKKIEPILVEIDNFVKSLEKDDEKL